MRDDRTFNGGMRDMLIFTDGMRDNYEIDRGMRDGNRKSHVTDVTRRNCLVSNREGLGTSL